MQLKKARGAKKLRTLSKGKVLQGKTFKVVHHGIRKVVINNSVIDKGAQQPSEEKYQRPYHERSATEKKYFWSDERIDELVRNAYTTAYQKHKDRK